MTPRPSPNTQAILLLTAPLLAGAREGSRPGAPEVLTFAEYNRFARLLREQQKQPADLLGPEAAAVLDHCSAPFGRPRLEALLARGMLLSQVVDRWYERALWVISRADPSYPRRLKSRLKESAPLLLYGCGQPALLDGGGLAVVGSRDADEERLRFTEEVGRLSAQARIPIVSGGAKGIDRAAMAGALREGGAVVGVLADSLERAALARDNRQVLMAESLVLVSPYDPAAGFHVGHAMQRNKVIYALADSALVVAADFEKGGTWAGAIEQLTRLRLVPLFVRNGPGAGEGNTALLAQGAKLWPSPRDSSELLIALAAAISSMTESRQETLAFDGSEPAQVEAPVTVTPPISPRTRPAPADRVFDAVREILQQELVRARTEAEVGDLLAVAKPQAKAWLLRLVEERIIEKLAKPVRYRLARGADRLLS